MAQRVDPTGERTVGVLTKTDLIDAGAEQEIVAVVNNVRKPLALGYVMVKNRSQKDINDKISTAKARYMVVLLYLPLCVHPLFSSEKWRHCFLLVILCLKNATLPCMA